MIKSASKTVEITDTDYFENRVIAIAYHVRKRTGIVHVSDVLKKFGIRSGGTAHAKVARILDDHGFRRKEAKRDPISADQRQAKNGWGNYTPFVCLVTPDQNTPNTF